jgi:hypothetical protein
MDTPIHKQPPISKSDHPDSRPMSQKHLQLNFGSLYLRNDYLLDKDNHSLNKGNTKQPTFGHYEMMLESLVTI